MSNNLGKRIQQAIFARGLTQKQLAKAVGLAEASMSRYISGERDPRTYVLANIAASLNTTSDYLLGLEESETDYSRIKHLIKTVIPKLTDIEKKDLANLLLSQ